MKKTKQERYQIAKVLESILRTAILANDEQVDALFDAIDIISPEYSADLSVELDAALNSPELLWDVEKICGKITPQEASALVAQWEAARERKTASASGS